MIGITTRTYRGFAIHIECADEAIPPFRATIRRRFQEAHPKPVVFRGASEEDVVSQAEAEVDRLLAAEATEGRQEIHHACRLRHGCVQPLQSWW
jgi:hypothetical protein